MTQNLVNGGEQTGFNVGAFIGEAAICRKERDYMQCRREEEENKVPQWRRIGKGLALS